MTKRDKIVVAVLLAAFVALFAVMFKSFRQGPSDTVRDSIFIQQRIEHLRNN